MKFESVGSCSLVLREFSFWEERGEVLRIDLSRVPDGFLVYPFVEIPANDLIVKLHGCKCNFITTVLNCHVSLDYLSVKNIETFDLVSHIARARLRDITTLPKEEDEDLGYSLSLIEGVGIAIGFFDDLTLLISHLSTQELACRYGIEELMRWSITNSCIVDVDSKILEYCLRLAHDLSS